MPALTRLTINNVTKTEVGSLRQGVVGFLKPAKFLESTPSAASPIVRFAACELLSLDSTHTFPGRESLNKGLPEMASYTLPRPIFRTTTVRVPAAPHYAAWIQGRVMKLLGWFATILVACMLAWLFVGAETLWPRMLIGLLLAGFGILVGLRFGTQGTAAYIADLQRVNKMLSEQQRELEEVNAILLKHVNAEAEPIPLFESGAPSERV